MYGVRAFQKVRLFASDLVCFESQFFRHSIVAACPVDRSGIGDSIDQCGINLSGQSCFHHAGQISQSISDGWLARRVLQQRPIEKCLLGDTLRGGNGVLLSAVENEALIRQFFQGRTRSRAETVPVLVPGLFERLEQANDFSSLPGIRQGKHC